MKKNKNKLAKVTKIKKSPRSLARSIALQGIYYFLQNHATLAEIEDHLYNHDTFLYQKADRELMKFLLEHAINEFESLLAQYSSLISREIKHIDLVEQAILIIAAIELNYSKQIHPTIVINEAIELAKLFGSVDSYKFINSVVDKLSHAIYDDAT